MVAHMQPIGEACSTPLVSYDCQKLKEKLRYLLADDATIKGKEIKGLSPCTVHSTTIAL